MLVDHVLFLDAEALVIDKPAGLPVDRPRDGSLSLENHLDALAFGFRRWPQPVHRLDRDTSGCLLLSRNPKAHARFAQAFERGEVEKIYLAVLDGVPAGEGGVIDLPLAKMSSAEAGWRVVGDPKGKPARTGWRVLRTEGGRALVEFRPETGRTHQIRVHAAEGLGCPVIGDAVYGRPHPSAAAPLSDGRGKEAPSPASGRGKGPAREASGKGEGLLLHARRLVLPRPGRPPVEAEAPVPDRFGTFAQ